MEERVFKPSVNRARFLFVIFLVIVVVLYIVYAEYNWALLMFGYIIITLSSMNYRSFVFTDHDVTITRYLFKPSILPYSQIKYRYKDLIVFERYTINLEDFQNRGELWEEFREYNRRGLLLLPIKRELNKKEKIRRLCGIAFLVLLSICVICLAIFLESRMSDMLLPATLCYAVALRLVYDIRRRT